MQRFDGRTAVVTGAAMGMGAATARRIAAEGGKVIVADIADAAGRAVADSVGGEFVHCDVSSEADIERCIARALELHGRLDVMVNNAGVVGPRSYVQDTTADDMRRAIDILLMGVLFGTKHAIRAMRESTAGGSIVSIASTGAILGGAPDIYTACKGGVVAFTRSVALHEAEAGIRVNCICPGGIVTDMLANDRGVVDEDERVRLRASLTEHNAGRQPLPWAGMPEDIAAAVAWLASDDARFVTGDTIVVDGGQTSTLRRDTSQRVAR